MPERISRGQIRPVLQKNKIYNKVANTSQGSNFEALDPNSGTIHASKAPTSSTSISSSSAIIIPHIWGTYMSRYYE